MNYTQCIHINLKTGGYVLHHFINKTPYIRSLKTNIVNPVLRDPLWEKEKNGLKTGSIRMKCFRTGQDKGGILIQVTALIEVTAWFDY